MPDADFPTIRLAAAQAAPVFLDRDATVDKACELIKEAGRSGADLVAFPEGFIPAHPVWFYHYPALSAESLSFARRLFHNSVEIPSPSTDRLCAAAAAARINVVIGLCQRRPGSAGTMWNSQLHIDRRGVIVGVHQKLVPTAAERLVHAGGAAAGMRAFDTDFGPVGGLICGENSNPLAINALIRDQVRVHVASWPNYFAPGWPPGMSETGMLTGRSIAYMAKCFVINACGTITPDVGELMARTEQDRAYFADPANLGGSTIIAPTGAIIAGPAGPGDEIIYADADLDQVVRTKLIHDLSGHYQRDDVFDFAVRADRAWPGGESPSGHSARRDSPGVLSPMSVSGADSDPAASGRWDVGDDRCDRPALSSPAGT
jgi:nitrilase